MIRLIKHKDQKMKMLTMHSELYLFLIWEHARTREDFILEEIKKQFIIRDVYEIKWNEKNFSDNMRRFYGPKLGNVFEKTNLCGTGSFLLIIISDSNPKFGRRRTANGMEMVNLNLYNSKRQYRKLTSKGFAIHSSLTSKETNDDLTLLLGKNTTDLEKTFPKKWDDSLKKIESDLMGQNGWTDMKELLYVLNSTINYVILRNFEGLPDKIFAYEHNDVDILTDDFLRIPYLANGGKSPLNDIFPETVKIGNKELSFDFGFPGDGYYDEKWSKDILKRRVFYNGFYVPSNEDYFYSLFYHAIFYQMKVSDEYKKKLVDLAEILNLNEISQQTLEDLDKSKKFLEQYMTRMGYLHTNSLKYKILHNKLSQYTKLSIYLWKKHGRQFLFTVIKRKIKRTILKTSNTK